MEDGSVINFGDPAFVAQFILLSEMMGPLPHNQDLHNTLCPVAVQPFLTDFFAGVE